MDISTPVISRSHPAIVRIKERYPLTKSGSTKHTVHISLDLAHSGIQFKVGDSIGIFAQNDPKIVQHFLSLLQATGEEIILDSRSNSDLSLRNFLTLKANLSRLTSSLLKLFYTHETSHDKKNHLHRLLQEENKPLLTQYLSTHDPLDFLREHQGTQVPLQDFCAQFAPMLPRFYSVASSQHVLKDEVHLTVALFSYNHQGEPRYGVGSHFLCHLAQEKHTPIPIYVQPAHAFTLPMDDTAPIIMVGPGTGVAPFRAFLQERIARNAPGKNWLFFGERNRSTDYLYESFWEDLKRKGALKLDLAFSRDQKEKVYVQDRMKAQAKELWDWLQEGAYFYVCGDAHRMAKDVEAALQLIAEEQGNMSPEAAKAYIKALRAQKRYLADVY